MSGIPKAAAGTRVLRIGRGVRVAPGETAIDLARYSHLEFFTAANEPAQFDHVTASIESRDGDHLRAILRDVDWLTAVGGRIELQGAEAHALMHFACRSVLGRQCDITTTATGLVCHKVRANPAHSVDNTLWSIAVMSNGNNEQRLQRLIDSIARQNIPEVELIVVGPSPQLELPHWCRSVRFDEHGRDPRFAITRKKNLFAKLARHENLLILHDRFRPRRRLVRGDVEFAQRMGCPCISRHS